MEKIRRNKARRNAHVVSEPDFAYSHYKMKSTKVILKEIDQMKQYLENSCC